MRRLDGIVLALLLLLPLGAWGANTHSPSDAQGEMRAWFGDGFTPWIVSGCLPTVPSSSLTFGAFACAGYVRGASAELVYVTQAAATVTLTNVNGTHWLALHRDTSSTVSGWSRRSGSHYLFQQTASQPAAPSGGLVVLKVTVAGGVITAVTPLSGRNGPVPLSVVAGLTNVKEFGATGDGTTDDTTAITQALAALPATGGTLVFPHGTYVVSSTLDLKDKRNIVLACASTSRRYANSQACTLQYTASANPFLTFNGAVGVTIRGLNLSYTHAAYADEFITVSQGTGAQDASEILFEDCSIMGNTAGSMAANSLLKLGDEMYDLTIQRCVLSGAVTAIRGSTTSVINANNITIRNNLFLSPFTSAQIRPGGSQWNIVENTFEPRSGTLGNALFVEAIGIEGIRIVGNLFLDGNSASTQWIQFSSGTGSGVYIAGNYFQDVHASSICISFGSLASTGIVIEGNHMTCEFPINGASVLDIHVSGNTYAYGTASGYGTYPSGKYFIQDDHEYKFHLTDTTQTDALLGARTNGSGTTTGNNVEWGHQSTAGFENVLGHTRTGGNGFVCLSCEHGTNANTYKTRGRVGRAIEYQTGGGLILGRVATASADNQSLTADVTLSATGVLTMGAGAIAHKVVTLTYPATAGGTITPDLSLGDIFKITITDANTFTIANPSGQAGAGAAFRFVLINSSGGAHGTISWGAQYHRVGSASLTVATGSNQTIEFTDAAVGGSVYYEAWRSSGDVPN